MATRIDGKAFADNLCDKLADEVDALKKEHGLQPCIAVVLVGEDPASQVYVRNKVRRCQQLGITSIEHRPSADITQDELMAIIDSLNSDETVHGILVQLPLPDHLDEEAVINAIR